MDVEDADRLEDVAVRLCRFLLEFFVEETDRGTELMRPLTNSNFIADFYRYRSAPYHKLLTSFLKLKFDGPVPDYEIQYRNVLQYYEETKCLHKYDKFSLGGAMSSSPNTKSLQIVTGSDGADRQLARADYYKYRAANFMFGFNSNIMSCIENFCEFNSLRKNQLLRFYEELQPVLKGSTQAIMSAKDRMAYRDYYFMSQFEVGSQELIDIHHHTFLIDLIAECGDDVDRVLVRRVNDINNALLPHTFFSTSKNGNYEKFLKLKSFQQTKKYRLYQEAFMSPKWHQDFVALGFAEINPKEKEINSLTQTVFYTTELMKSQQHRRAYEFEKECINQMARSTIRMYSSQFRCHLDMQQKYKIHAKIGFGFTYSKYNTLMHFLNVVQSYWRNPDLSNISIFGKDIRTLLAISSQKIFFEDRHDGFYHYGPFEVPAAGYSSSGSDYDLAVAQRLDLAPAGVSQQRSNGANNLVVTDRVYEFNYLKGILERVFESANGVQFKSDNEVLNLCLLSLMLDFGVFQRFVGLLNLPFLKDLQHMSDTRELQVEVANLIYEFDRKNSADSVTRSRVEELIFETSYKFLGESLDCSVWSPLWVFVTVDVVVLTIVLFHSLPPLTQNSEQEHGHKIASVQAHPSIEF